VAVVAEVKRRSPSKGEINPALAPAEQARAYAAGGAAAISVLTEPAHFGGSTADLETVRGAVALPLLRKDFIVDPVQVAEARAAGASAVLLIARALPPERLGELADAARHWRLEPLIEVRSEGELRCAIDARAGVIGVNSRDLETLEIDRGVTEHLLPLIPEGCVAIAESGVRTAHEVEWAAAAGADAVLVGTAVSAAADPEAAVRELTRVRRVGRGGH
jgi:indole-3-glycerol phosphate synthase